MRIARDLATVLIGSPAGKTHVYYRAMVSSKARGWGKLARLFSMKLRSYGLYIAHQATLPKKILFPHPTGIVIGEGCSVAEDVTIYQGVTLGGRRSGDWQSGNYPKIGKSSTIFAGAVVLGDISVGKNCVIGANAVVLEDMPDNSVAVGVPARIKSRTGNP